MSFKQKLTFGLAVFALSSGLAMAATPANVQNVTATLEGGKLQVSWYPVPGAARYNIYYSRESILGNRGDYDDFESTTGPQTAYAFKAMPQTSGTVYVGVLAVGADGVESDGFETETSAYIGDALPPQSGNPNASGTVVPGTMPSGENPTSTAVPMTIVSVQPTSSTGMTVSFSKPIRPLAAVNPAFFLITDTGGVILPIVNVRIEGQNVLLEMKPQEAERTYLLSILLPIPADDGTNATASTPRVEFKGYGTKQQGGASSSVQSSVSSSVASSDPRFGTTNPLPPPPAPTASLIRDPAALDLTATPRNDGTYNVLAAWTQAPGAKGYTLYTSTDGKQYTRNFTVADTQTSVKYERIPAGTFGLRVITADARGGESSPGVERVINLPASGLGFLGLMLTAGAAAGRRMRRKKETV